MASSSSNEDIRRYSSNSVVNMAVPELIIRKSLEYPKSSARGTEAVTTCKIPHIHAATKHHLHFNHLGFASH